MSSPPQIDDRIGPWKPGIRSQPPADIRSLATIYRDGNSFTGFRTARELAQFTGLPAHELTAFRPGRLSVHEVLVRVTADIAVPDGPKYEDLGISFRTIAGTILDRHIAPHAAEIAAAHDALRARVTALVTEALGAPASAPAPAAPRPRLPGLFRRRGAPPAREDPEVREHRLIAGWQRNAVAAADPVDEAAWRALVRVAHAICGRHGRLRGEPAMIARLVATLVCNAEGSAMIGRMIEPWLRAGAAAEGYRLLPAQERPVVMNVKGASASGKSSMRPLQRRLAAEIGIDWADFALISPDVWRKYLLDYDSLGTASKYAGPLTGHEVAIIDHKLDRYMAEKADRRGMSHLLIDRFRFDSFAPNPDEEEGSTLLTRFGHLVYMFFMITPPDATVERAWRRGLMYGRYKAVDDLLHHNVEAFTGMPRLFFTWALKESKRVHYEFLDNSVTEGERPRTVAYGWNGEMNVLDIKCMIDVDRYTRINVDARDAGEVYPDADAMAATNNTAFLRQCACTIPVLNFAAFNTGRIYARLEHGRLVWTDPECRALAMRDPETRAGLAALGADAAAPAASGTTTPRFLDRIGAQTLGKWAGDPE
jgi:hypothetical protein